jgi:transposase
MPIEQIVHQFSSMAHPVSAYLMPARSARAWDICHFLPGAWDVAGICPSSTAHDRFEEWVKAGVFYRLWKAGLLEYDRKKGLIGRGNRWMEQ